MQCKFLASGLMLLFSGLCLSLCGVCYLGDVWLAWSNREADDKVEVCIRYHRNEAYLILASLELIALQLSLDTLSQS